jgi:hypothetical protein
MNSKKVSPVGSGDKYLVLLTHFLWSPTYLNRNIPNVYAGRRVLGDF